MIVDTSAVMSAATLVELAQVAEDRGGPAMRDEMDSLIARSGIEVVAFTPEHARIAREGWRRYGKGRGHAARLNLGDLFARALAQERDEPLPFKGDDFPRTDVKPAI